ncbi:MAG: InlB B-repeat-containing protein, partial [Clostridiales bacterium]|nr:InlB B-repeat-containing protein [Clostridiales bacterium]
MKFTKKGKLLAVLVAVLMVATMLPAGTVFGHGGSPTYKVDYDKNGADGGDCPADVTGLHWGDEVTVADAQNLYQYIWGDLKFFGSWNTHWLGFGTTYNPGDKITINYSDVHLYAQFTERGYELEYDNNGGSGSTPSTQRARAGTSVQVADGSHLTKSGDVFDHWNTRSNGTGTSYNPGASITLNGNE